MGHFAQDCLKPRKNANIAQENEQNRKLAELVDLGDSSVCEECAMICTDAYSDEEYEEIVVYRDQGITSKKFDEDMYGDLMNTDSDEEPVVKYNVALCDSLAVPQKNEKMRTKICQHFEMPNVMQATYFGSHRVIISHLFGISKC